MLALYLENERVVQIPHGLDSLEKFRRWTEAENFPRRGRIDYIAGDIHSDMTADRLNTHARVFSAMFGVLWNLIETTGLGKMVGSHSRLVSIPADLSCEPDLIIFLQESVRAGRVRFNLAQDPVSADDFFDIEGGPDIVVEILSPSSKRKDKVILPPAYYAAGVREYWLVDALRDDVSFAIHGRGAASFEAFTPDTEGSVRSEVLGKTFRVVRLPETQGDSVRTYRLEVKD